MARFLEASNFVECLAARHEDGVVLGVYLPTANDAVDVDRIEFGEISPSAGLMGRNKRRSASSGISVLWGRV